MVYLWRAVDAEGEVLDVLVQSKRNKHAALKLMRKLLRKYAFVPERLVTENLRSYSAAVWDLGIERRHERGRWKNNRAENSHQPTRRRERKMQRSRVRVQPRDFSPRTPLSTTSLTSNAISSRPKRTARFAPRWIPGALRSQPPDNSSGADTSRSLHGSSRSSRTSTSSSSRYAGRRRPSSRTRLRRLPRRQAQRDLHRRPRARVIMLTSPCH
jgi:DDE superfamily endonuclease